MRLTNKEKEAPLCMKNMYFKTGGVFRMEMLRRKGIYCLCWVVAINCLGFVVYQFIQKLWNHFVHGFIRELAGSYGTVTAAAVL